LVVDDEPTVRFVCEAVVRHIGYSPILAVDGEHGLDIFGQLLHEIDLVIADVSMPKLDGIEMVRKMFEMKPHSNVILMTGYTPEQIIPDNVLKLCAALAKPFTVQQLTDAIRKCLEHDHHRG
jgi:DNA-binding NtrC family response regulator